MGNPETDAKPTGRRKAVAPPKPSRLAEAVRAGKPFTFDPPLTVEEVAQKRRSAYAYLL